jgi:serine/threonine-protein kinase RsbW
MPAPDEVTIWCEKTVGLAGRVRGHLGYAVSDSDDAMSRPLELPTGPSAYGVSLGLRLPRDALSVPVIRHLVRYALTEVGVLEHVSDDIELALAEACTNVLNHSGPGDSYDVSVTIGPEVCEIRVIDIGHGFDHATVLEASDLGTPDLNAERGRGLGLMHALVDHVELRSVPESGTLVRLIKKLDFDDAAAAERLLFQALHPPTAQ